MLFWPVDERYGAENTIFSDAYIDSQGEVKLSGRVVFGKNNLKIFRSKKSNEI